MIIVSTVCRYQCILFFGFKRVFVVPIIFSFDHVLITEAPFPNSCFLVLQYLNLSLVRASSDLDKMLYCLAEVQE